MAINLPTVITATGLQPQTPASLLTQLLSSVAALSPGYTASLPGSLIEDISSTDVAAIVLCDNARVETVASLTPYGANPWLLNELGQIYGVEYETSSYVSVGVIFFSPSINYAIPAGFTVTDGLYTYVVQDGGIIESSGQSAVLTCVATQSGTWSVPPGTVNQLSTSVPSIYTITCVNPLAGVPGTTAESLADYQSRVLTAGLAASQGMPRYFKTIVGNVPGVQSRLIAIKQQVIGGWKAIVGGGDNSAVAYAIFQSLLDVSTLAPSLMAITAITNASNAKITTSLTHGYSIGQVVVATGVVGMVGINNLNLTINDIIDAYNFTVTTNTTTFGAYISGGVLLPNLRNIYEPVIDYPDVYQIVFISPPQQLVTMTITWNTIATNYINQSSIATTGAPAVASYVNNIAVTQPINIFEVQSTFQTAISSILAPNLLTRIVVAVSINGIGVSPSAGTGIIAGDPESYFYTDPTGIDITIIQG